MSKPIASYLVRITLREPEDLDPAAPVINPPTVRGIEELIDAALTEDGTVREAASAYGAHAYTVRVTAERTDI